jgi:hypothetical protein
MAHVDKRYYRLPTQVPFIFGLDSFTKVRRHLDVNFVWTKEDLINVWSVEDYDKTVAIMRNSLDGVGYRTISTLPVRRSRSAVKWAMADCIVFSTARRKFNLTSYNGF